MYYNVHGSGTSRLKTYALHYLRRNSYSGLLMSFGYDDMMRLTHLNCGVLLIVVLWMHQLREQARQIIRIIFFKDHCARGWGQITKHHNHSEVIQFQFQTCIIKYDSLLGNESKLFTMIRVSGFDWPLFE